jgi:hypothetical protein
LAELEVPVLKGALVIVLGDGKKGSRGVSIVRQEEEKDISAHLVDALELPPALEVAELADEVDDLFGRALVEVLLLEVLTLEAEID